MIAMKDCGCYGPGHHSNCKHFNKAVRILHSDPVDTTKETVERFVKTGVGKAVWNTALDEAAKRCDAVLECKAAARIRELMK